MTTTGVPQFSCKLIEKMMILGGILGPQYWQIHIYIYQQNIFPVHIEPYLCVYIYIYAYDKS